MCVTYYGAARYLFPVILLVTCTCWPYHCHSYYTYVIRTKLKLKSVQVSQNNVNCRGVKQKGEVVLVHTIMAYGGLELWLHLFLTWAVD